MLTLIFVALATCHITQATTFYQCNDKSDPQPLAVRITNCETTPCDLVRTTNVILEIDFEANRDMAEMKTEVRALALGVMTSYPLPNDDVCAFLTNGECPLDSGEVVTYRLTMPILDSFPKVHVVIEFSLESGTDTVACFKIPANVVDP